MRFLRAETFSLTPVLYLRRNDIVGWCESPGALVTWNIFRRGFAEEEEHVPDMMVDHSRHVSRRILNLGRITQLSVYSMHPPLSASIANPSPHLRPYSATPTSCLLCVSCHPLKPAMIAAGSFNGEVLAELPR